MSISAEAHTGAELKFTGCPAVMNWVAKELGVEKDQIQIYVDRRDGIVAATFSPAIYVPGFKNTALVLMDADGSTD